MSSQRYSSEFKDETARQGVDRRYSVAEISERLGEPTHSLYNWVKVTTPDNSERQAAALIEAENEALEFRAQLKRTEEERDKPKWPLGTSQSSPNEDDLDVAKPISPDSVSVALFYPDYCAGSCPAMSGVFTTKNTR